MAVAMLLQAPNGTPEHYEALTKEMFGSLQPDDLPEGMIFHAAGVASDGVWRVFDVWENEDALNRFFEERVQPARERIGNDPTAGVRPQVYPVHNMMGAGRA